MYAPTQRPVLRLNSITPEAEDSVALAQISWQWRETAEAKTEQKGEKSSNQLHVLALSNTCTVDINLYAFVQLQEKSFRHAQDGHGISRVAWEARSIALEHFTTVTKRKPACLGVAHELLQCRRDRRGGVARGLLGEFRRQDMKAVLQACLRVTMQFPQHHLAGTSPFGFV